MPDRRLSSGCHGAVWPGARRLSCLQPAPRLWPDDGLGPSGPLAPAAGHDINYIALSGALHAIGTPGAAAAAAQPGGRLWRRRHAAGLGHAGGAGRHGLARAVVDAAARTMAALLMAMMYGVKAGGLWTDQRGANLLDGAPSTAPMRVPTANIWPSGRLSRSSIACSSRRPASPTLTWRASTI